MALNTKQIKALRSQAHSLKPVVMIGQNGLTDNVINEIQLALEHHELIKIRVGAADRQQRMDITKQVAKTTLSEHIQSIGHIGIFYRHNPKRNRIPIPKK